MTGPAREHWLRAVEALGSAELNYAHGLGDYGEPTMVDEDAVRRALASVRRILEAVRRDLPADFPGLPGAYDAGGSLPGA